MNRPTAEQTATARALTPTPSAWVVLTYSPATNLFSAIGLHADERGAWEQAAGFNSDRGTAWATVVPLADPQPGDPIGWAEPPLGTVLRVGRRDGTGAELQTDVERRPDGWVWLPGPEDSQYRSRFRFEWRIVAASVMAEGATVVRWGP